MNGNYPGHNGSNGDPNLPGRMPGGGGNNNGLPHLAPNNDGESKYVSGGLSPKTTEELSKKLEEVSQDAIKIRRKLEHDVERVETKLANGIPAASLVHDFNIVNEERCKLGNVIMTQKDFTTILSETTQPFQSHHRAYTNQINTFNQATSLLSQHISIDPNNFKFN